MLTTDITGEVGYCAYEGDDAYCDSFSGTSAAAPVVSGVVLLMIEANPRLTAAQVREVLCDTAAPIDVHHNRDTAAPYNTEGWSPYYGCGRVDAGAAVAAVVNTEPGQPVPQPVNGTTTEARVVLQWAAAPDPDDDRLDYTLRWWTDDEDDNDEVLLSGLSVDLTGLVLAGESVHWTVQAADGWGAGPMSARARLVVTAVPTEPPAVESGARPPPAGCSGG
jgi:hypothetical protein